MRAITIAICLATAGCATNADWQPIDAQPADKLAAAQTICQAERQKAYMTSREGLTVFTFSRLSDVFDGCMAQQGYAKR